VAEFERDKNFGDLFLAKLKTTITFAMVIRMTIIIYAFGVEENFPCHGNGKNLWSISVLNLKNQPFTKLFYFFSIFVLFFKTFLRYFS